jgi:branched-chain amino acid transport system ATP-binding protein
LHNGYVASGRIGFDGNQIVNVAPHRLVRMGMGQVPEGRMVFKQLSVEDNLAVGAAILPRALQCANAWTLCMNYFLAC